MIRSWLMLLPAVFFAAAVGACGDSSTKADSGTDPIAEEDDTGHDGTDIQNDQQPDPVEDTAPDNDDPAVDPGTDTVPEVTPEVEDASDAADDDVEPDAVEDPEPDVACVPEGCTAREGIRCCPGLAPAHECDPGTGEASCIPEYCIDCGDGKCDPHENCYNCIADCVNPCVADDYVMITCGLIETHHCTCNPPECIPVCWTDPGTAGWYDPCSGGLIREDEDCTGQTAVCEAVCSRSEGWYESLTGELINWDFCRNEWECSIAW